jgi:hypothetical protein
MQDHPSADDMLESAARFLREEAAPALEGRLAFHARVAANAIELARREARLTPGAAAEELARLRALLGEEGGLDALNRRLTEKIADGAMMLETPGLRDHLWRTAMDKLAVDQPTYATYKRALQRGNR